MDWCSERIGVLHVVILAHGIPEDDTGLGRSMCIGDNRIPQFARAHRSIHSALKAQIEIGVSEHGLHKLVRDQYADVRILCLGPIRIIFNCDEALDIGMINAQSEHERTASTSLRNGIRAL